MNFLKENITFDNARIQLMEDDSVDFHGNKTKSLYMKGIFIQGNVRNHNNRMYPISEIRNAVDTLATQIKEGYSVVGEADHPEELNINMDRVSHVITDIYMDGANGCGKLKILPTPMGNIAKTLLENGIKLGVSSRGSGNVSDNGNVSDYEIVTIDLVVKPSGPQCFPDPVYESIRGKRGKIITDLAESVRYDPKAQKYLKEELINWFTKF